MLVLSVSADGLMGNYQKKLFGAYLDLSAEEMTLITTSLSVLIIIVGLVVTGNFVDGFQAVNV